MIFQYTKVSLLLFCLCLLNTLNQTTSYLFNGFEILDLYASTLTDMQYDYVYWSIPAKVPGVNSTTCYSFPYIGGPDILLGSGTYSQRIYKNLPPHDIIYYSIFFLLLDHWTSTDSFVLQFGPNSVHIQNFISGSSQFTGGICGWGGTRYGMFMRLLGRVSHNLPELDFRVISYLNGPTSDRSFAFRAISLNFGNKPAGQTEFVCADPLIGSYTGSSPFFCSCSSSEYKDSSGVCQPCNANCAWCFGPSASECYLCQGGTYFDGTSCIVCSAACLVCHGTTADQCNYCSAGYFLIGSSCISPCDPPLVFNPLASPQTCTYPCAPNQYLYPDSSCSDSCPAPLVPYIKYTTTQFCKSNCGTDYAYFDNYCNSQCPTPFTPIIYQNLKVCDPPVCGPRPCTFCNSNNDCLNYYSCVMTSIGKGLCISYITYSLNSALSKTIINGYTISVNVVPTLDLVEGPNDVLILEIDNLVQGVDYVASIQRLSIGVYSVTVQITHAINSDSLLARFTYSPAILNLKSELTLPHIVYISPELQSAADTVKTASIISFGLMMVNTIGFVMSGGLATIWSFLPEDQYMYYLLYLNVDYLYHTKTYFRSLANYDMLINVMSNDNQGNEDDDGTGGSASLPVRFRDEEYSPRFQDNAGQVLITLAVIAVAIAVVTILFKLLAIPRRSYLAHRVLKMLRRVIRWNGIIRQLLSYSLAMILASFIQLYVEIFGDSLTLFSTLLAILSIVIVIIGFKVMSDLLQNIPKSRFERVIYSEWYGTLWEDLNLESKTTRYYYWIVSLRGVALSHVAVFCDTFPLMQIIILILYQCYIVSFFLCKSGIQKVFETHSLNIVSFAEQLLILAMKIIILASYILSKHTRDNDLLILVGWITIAPGAIIQLMQCVYSTVIQIRELRNLFKKIVRTIKRLFLKEKIITKKIKRVKVAHRLQHVK